jgi:hypothetical protein
MESDASTGCSSRTAHKQALNDENTLLNANLLF